MTFDNNICTLNKFTEVKYLLHLGNAYFRIYNSDNNKTFHYYVEKVKNYYKVYIKLFNPTRNKYRYENIGYYTLQGDSISKFQYTTSPFKSCSESIAFEKILKMALNRNLPQNLMFILEDRCLISGDKLRSKKAVKMRIQPKLYDTLEPRIQTMLNLEYLF